MVVLIANLVLLAPPAAATAIDWGRLAPLPDPEGFAGSYAGVSHGALLVAGGANFPDKKPWENGTKVWTDAVYVLDAPEGRWKPAGRLPRPLGYGVSVSYQDSVILTGGSDARQHYADVYRMQWTQNQLVIQTAPPLPRAIANSCGALVGETLYVIGGQNHADDVPLETRVYSLKLSDAQAHWREEPPLPGGGRILAVAAAVGETLYVAGGAILTGGPDGKPKRIYRNDVYRLRSGPARRWERVADLPHPVVASPSPAPSDASGFYVLGGDDGSRVNFTPPEKHPGFTRSVLRYNHVSDHWEVIGDWPTPRVVNAAVFWADRWVIPTGEARPGVRSPEVWTFRFPR